MVIGKYQVEDAWLLLLRMVGRREGGRLERRQPAGCKCQILRFSFLL